MQKIIDDYIAMNIAGQVLELCQKYYANNVLMLNNGQVFAESMQESYDKQQKYIGLVTKFEVKLLSAKIQGNLSELVFHYKMHGTDSVNEFTGKHIQTWENEKIVREEYLSIDPVV
ncbi:hypothetical protein A9R01_07935 ['Osedax' symbiont bacterium Rs2_46_30_T18]|nr:hypothetical protein A9R01_07935 ['Osedax' symbiont bacterium Rs2_46_30_T18]